MRPKFIHYVLLLIFIMAQLTHLGNSSVNEVNFQKLHPKFRALFAENETINIFKKDNAVSAKSYIDSKGQQRFGVIIRTGDISELRAANVQMNSVYPGFVTAKVTLDEISRMARMKSIKFVDAPSISYTKMNVSAPVTGATLLQNSFYNNTVYAGEGAIVVIYDSGIDFNHIDFKNPSDTTQSRILAIWDQTISPVSGESNPSGFNYGVEYTQAQINDEIDGSPAGFVRQEDTDGHGTHVAGTAVGSGVKFTGIAPKADIIVVKGGDGSFAEDDIINGLTYAENKAKALGKPVVINLSLGGHVGPHDGSRAYELAIDTFNGKIGQAAIVAAGNEGDSNIHISGSVSSGGGASFKINVPPEYMPTDGTDNDEFIFDLWYDENVSVTATVTSPNGVSYSRGFNTDGSLLNDTDGKIYLENRRVDGSKQRILLYVSDEKVGKEPASGTWTLELEGASGNLTYDGWLARSDLGGESASLLNGDINSTIAMPGTSNDAITVGAFVTKTSWPANDGNQYLYTDDDELGQIANFSSHGPTRDGRTKPEITAPGKGIVSAFSFVSDGSDVVLNPNGKHILSQGTSMATPHVAGAAAVLFGVDPTMTASQLKTLLATTAIKDTETGSNANNTWGDGKLDLLKALIVKVSGDQSVTRTVQRYFANESGPYYAYSGTVKFAVRYTAPHEGALTGAFLELIISHPDINPIIDGDSDLEVAIYSDNNGVPGTQIGNTVLHSLSNFDPGTNNYINLLGANVTLSKDQMFHIVLKLSNPADEIKVLFDDGLNEQVENPSLISVTKTWETTKSAFGTPYNLRMSAEIVNTGPASSVEVKKEIIAHTFNLDQNYPNPFNPSTNIQFSLGQSSPVNLTIFDILGREVVTLIDNAMTTGVHEISWDSRNSSGYRVPSGIYFYRLRSNEGVLTKKMLLVK
jgi:minor extracellular serine protease Vpr